MNAPVPTVALIGNPNTGKSTLFNALTGLRQHVGNYPGVTVELKHGKCTLAPGNAVTLIDLPGTYSLAPRSPDEMVSVDLLLGHLKGEPKPGAILSVVDASNLDRHLYLTSQLMELGVPVVIAVNLVDVAASRGITIDLARLSERLGCPVIAVQANKSIGIDVLKGAIAAALQDRKIPQAPAMPDAFRKEATSLRELLDPQTEPFLHERLLCDIGGHTEQRFAETFGPKVRDLVQSARTRLAEAGCPLPATEARVRYGWIRERLDGLITKPAQRPTTLSDRLDRVFTHRVWGTLVFLLLMFGIFQGIFIGAKPVMDLISDGNDWLADRVKEAMGSGPLRNLLTDGVIKGVGSVLVFLPQILFLFAVIAVLEDCGYMARAAFLMDKIMSKCGLNGKSFIPLLSSVACAVPGIMATRVIENRRDRLATILVAPLMSCSARLPLYALLIGVFLSDPWWLPGLALFGMYLIGLIVAPLVALLLKRTLLRGETPLFVMEMPAFKMPQIRTIVRRSLEAGWAFVRRAGTMILATMILVWASLYFTGSEPGGRDFETKTSELKEKAEALEEGDEKEAIEKEYQTLYGEWKRQSYLGRAGRGLEPVFRPLGWDWRIGMAALASFPAREVVVGTLGMIYNQGDVDPGDLEGKPAGETPLGQAIHTEWSNDPVNGKYRVPVALGLLVFFALCCQCVSTLAVIRRETKSWWWPAFTFGYMTLLAYVGALVTFQIGKLIVG